MIKYVWENEETPQIWNLGHITTIWKGSGDKENLSNHRGITYSDTIVETIEHAIHDMIYFKSIGTIGTWL